MTYARSILVPPGSPGTYHCVARCVGRGWRGGKDRECGCSSEHRRQWVEDRIGELADGGAEFLPSARGTSGRSVMLTY